MGAVYTMTEEMRISELHRLYRYMLKDNAEITDVKHIHPNTYHITLGWWAQGTQDSSGIDYKFWSSHKIILYPQVCKIT